MTTDPIETLDADPLGLTPQVTRELRPCASYTLRVNGFERPVTDAWIGESLLYVLRERLGLAGAKDGCEQGECGACSVQVDGQLVAGCLVPAALAADSEINTVEGLSAGGGASDVQQALAASGAVQCGYCTPGMAMAVHDLLQRNHRPTDVEARQALCGNLCRCTGYRGVLAAVQTVADARALEAEEAEEAAAAAAEEAVAEQPVGGAPAEATVGQPAAVEPEPVVEPPVYADAEAWIEHVPQPIAEPAPVPAQADPGYGDGGYDTGVYDTSALAAMPPGIPAQAADDHVYYPPQGYPEQAYQATPAHGTYVPAGFPDGHPPQHGYDTGYDAPVYEPTPAHGTPYADPHGAPAEGGAPAGAPYTATPAHGIRLPEDDHAS
ncbi:2Fe-2S iron-sulfur cluster-binding protein [Kitasatospora sp. NPDC058190]|uniref:2Fe-2S iron-sulfur cluster-binding protein n=1 Tax=Kitasatospora sp. NPDC058190 TaxID=3346371 RepID=UPI0036DB5E44